MFRQIRFLVCTEHFLIWENLFPNSLQCEITMQERKMALITEAIDLAEYRNNSSQEWKHFAMFAVPRRRAFWGTLALVYLMRKQ